MTDPDRWTPRHVPRVVEVEQAVLLACARSTLDEAAAGRLRALLRAPIRWDLLIDLAEVQQVGPLLAHHLAGAFAPSCPASVVARLRAMLQANAARNLYLAGELVQVLRLLAAHGIRALAYKGPVLAVGIYRNLALRWFGDVDILVHGWDYHFTVPRVLEAHGWHAERDLGFERTWRKGHVALDVHAAITPQRLMPFALRFEDAWVRRMSLSLPEGEVPTFAPEDMLIVLCVQLAKDTAETRRAPIIIKVCDIAELLRRLRPRAGSVVVRRARRLGVLRIVLLGVSVAHHLLDAPVPSELRQRLPRVRGRLDALVRHVEERVLDGKAVPPSRPDWLDFDRWNSALRERARDRCPRLRGMAHDLLAPCDADYRYLRLPRPLWPLYPLVRPLRLIHRHGARVPPRTGGKATG